MEAIGLKDVSKVYPMGEVDVFALKNIDLSIKKGDFIAVMGPSGSGKSTLMNMVGCLDLPSKGQIYLDGQNIQELDENELAKLRGRKIGFIFQRFNLIPSLSARENVMLAMGFQGVSREEQFDRATELLELVSLDHRLDHKPAEMSGGEQQRVAIARALANDPEILLADEPTGNLDSKTGKEVVEFLKKLYKDGKTIIMVTHDENVAKEAEKIIRIKDGGIDE
tara:strand:+ start:95 stop:763 length:669 start_codon:yes stop_codon:yes gene_type:complete